MRPSVLALLIALALLLSVPVAASASEWTSGNVFVGLSTGQYNVYSNSGELQETIDQTVTGANQFAVDCAFDNAGRLHTTAITQDRVVPFLGPHPHTRQPDVVVGDRPESISYARDGSYYVGHDPTAPGNSLRRLSGAGTPLQTFNPAHSASLIDLASDQKTIYYTSRGDTGFTAVHRFDVAADADLPDLVDLGTQLADIKLLSPGDGSGGLLVSRTADVVRLDADGRVVKTYDVAGEDNWFGVALDPDGRSFWAQTSSPGNVFRFDIASGAVDRGPLPSAASAFGICVKGARTAALDNAPPRATITSPADGASFQQGARVLAAYTCADDANGTGIASCEGTVPAGTPIDTGSPGAKRFEVVATDNAGNRATRSVTYTVTAPPPPPPPVVAPPPPPPPPAPERIQVTMSFGHDAPGRRATRINDLVIREIPRGAVLRVTCDPPGSRRCPARKVIKRNAKRTVKVRSFRKTYRAGTVIQARVTKPGTIGAVKLLKIRKLKKPVLATRCLPDGASRPRRC